VQTVPYGFPTPRRLLSGHRRYTDQPTSGGPEPLRAAMAVAARVMAGSDSSGVYAGDH
jgi:hypothetical protein